LYINERVVRDCNINNHLRDLVRNKQLRYDTNECRKSGMGMASREAVS